MVDAVDLIREQEDSLEKLDSAIDVYASKGQKLAKAEADYRIAKSNRIVELKHNGMAVTIIEKIANGESEIAKLRLERDIALANYKACQEYIQVQKLKIKILQSQIDKEYGRYD